MAARAMWFILCFVLLLPGGCGKSSSSAPSLNALSGKVLFKGQPLTGGEITFRPKGGAPISTRISPEGTYSVSLPFTGEASVTVIGPQGTEGSAANIPPEAANYKSPAGESGEAKAPKGKKVEMSQEQREQFQKLYGKGKTGEKGLAIPKKYSDTVNTPLKITVKGGAQNEDINLTD